MIYFLNTDIPDKKAAPKALQKVFGVGKKKILPSYVNF